MKREVLDQGCERGILWLVLAILVFGPLATGAVDTLEFVIVQFLAVGVMILWGVRLWISPKPQLLWPPICWAVVAFGLYAVIRYLTSDIEYVARTELLRVLVYGFLFFAVLNNLHRQETTQLISFTLIAVALVVSFWAVYQFLTGSTRVPSLGAVIESLIFHGRHWYYTTPYVHRAPGTYINPNHSSGFLEMLMPLALAYTLTSRIKPEAKVFTGYAALAMAAGITVSLSRGSWVSAGLALALFFGLLLFHRSYWLPALVLLVVLVGAGAVTVSKNYSLRARLAQLLTQGKLNDDTRLALWRPALVIWRENPWWGAGPAHFDYRFRPYRPLEVQMRPDRAHNDFLNTLADWGLAGLAMVGAALVLLAVGVARTWPIVRGSTDAFRPKKSSRFAFVLGATCGLLALCFHSLVDFNMHIPANAIVAICLMALLSSHLRFVTDSYWLTPGVWIKSAVSAFLLAGVVYLTAQGWRHAVEYYWLERASGAPAFSPAQVALLEKAYAVEPCNADTTYAIGEAYRVQSKEGDDDYKELAAKAMEWFERSMKLNRWDGYNYLRYGSCLDWVGRKAEAGPYFERAAELDPNGYFTMANIGLHYVQSGDFAAAKPWFERSNRLQWEDNPIAKTYLDLVNRKLMEGATNEFKVDALPRPGGVGASINPKSEIRNPAPPP